MTALIARISSEKSAEALLETALGVDTPNCDRSVMQDLTALPTRIASKIGEPDDNGCWPWLAQITNGYGISSLGGRHMTAHRVVYELLVGPVDAGLHVDHLCRVRHCVNPEHLEPVTPSENTRRGLTPSLNRARAAAQTHCKHGHEYTEENTYRAPNGGRFCNACRRAKQRPGVSCCGCGVEISFNKSKPAKRCKSCATRHWRSRA